MIFKRHNDATSAEKVQVITQIFSQHGNKLFGSFSVYKTADCESIRDEIISRPDPFHLIIKLKQSVLFKNSYLVVWHISGSTPNLEHLANLAAGLPRA